jgi:Uma2 family endonuclease
VVPIVFLWRLRCTLGTRFLGALRHGTRAQAKAGLLVHSRNPAPSPIHQRISRRLQRQLEDYFHERSTCEVFNAPIDLILTKHDVFEPDILVTANPSDITKRGIEAPALLVVEILSPSTRKATRR